MPPKKERAKKTRKKRAKSTEEVQEKESDRLTGITVDVTRSYAKKVNCSAHGGLQYETIDFFSSLTAKDIKIEDSQEVGDALYAQCREDVNAAVTAYDELMLSGDDSETPKKKKRKKKEGIEVDKDEIEEIMPLLTKITDADSKEELTAIAEEVKGQEDDLSKAQFDHLRIQIRKRYKEVE